MKCLLIHKLNTMLSKIKQCNWMYSSAIVYIIQCETIWTTNQEASFDKGNGPG